MPFISQDPRRRIGAVVVVVVLLVIFYFLYDYIQKHYTTDPLLLIMMLAFSIVLLVSPLLFETKKKSAQEPFTPVAIGAAEKPGRLILRTCPKCKMLLPGSVWKCPNCGTTFPESMGVESNPTKLKHFEI